MRLRTILYHSNSFWASPHLYHSPRHAFERDRRDWVALGSPGWFTNWEIEARYAAINAVHSLHGWYGYDGEYEIVDLELLMYNKEYIKHRIRIGQCQSAQRECTDELNRITLNRLKAFYDGDADNDGRVEAIWYRMEELRRIEQGLDI